MYSVVASSAASAMSARRPALRATIVRREAYALPPALIQRAELLTKVSAGGRAQSVARYDLLTKATLLEIRLPAESTLWTVFLDEQPTKPQKENDSLLLSLPAQEQITLRKLQLAYESPVAPLGLSGTIEATSPMLLVRAAGTDAEREIPQADLQWQLILPSGYNVRRALGTVGTDDIPPRELAAAKVGRFLYELAGGIRPWYGVASYESAAKLRFQCSNRHPRQQRRSPCRRLQRLHRLAACRAGRTRSYSSEVRAWKRNRRRVSRQQLKRNEIAS